MDRLDQYIKKYLTDYSPAEDEWNVPSDDVWDQVAPQLPKPVKRRLKWLNMLLLLCIVMGISGGIWYAYDNVSTDSQKDMHYNFAKMENDNAEINTNNQNTNQISSDSEFSYPTENPVPSVQKTNKSLTENINSASQNGHVANVTQSANSASKAIIPNQKPLGDNVPIPNTINPKVNVPIPNDQSVVYNISLDNQLGKDHLNRSGKNLHNTKASHDELISESVIKQDQSTPTSSIPKEMTITEQNTTQHSKKSDATLLLSPLPTFNSYSNLQSLLKNNQPRIRTPLINPINIPTSNNWELGYSNSDYYFSKPYELWTKDQVGELNSLDSDSDYSGINLQIAKRLKGRLFGGGILKGKMSIASGIFMSTQHVVLDIEEIATWNSDANIANSRSDITITDGQLKVDFEPGVTISNDELIRLEGTPDVDVFSLRIPLALRYHFKESENTNLFIESGISMGFDYFNTPATFNEIEVYREGVLIGRAEGNVEGGAIPQASIYLGLGWRKPLSTKWNWGGSLNVDKRVGLTSYYMRTELGLFYDL